MCVSLDLASVELMALPKNLIIPASQLQLKDTLGQGRCETADTVMRKWLTVKCAGYIVNG